MPLECLSNLIRSSSMGGTSAINQSGRAPPPPPLEAGVGLGVTPEELLELLLDDEELEDELLDDELDEEEELELLDEEEELLLEEEELDEELPV